MSTPYYTLFHCLLNLISLATLGHARLIGWRCSVGLGAVALACGWLVIADPTALDVVEKPRVAHKYQKLRCADISFGHWQAVFSFPCATTEHTHTRCFLVVLVGATSRGVIENHSVWVAHTY